MRHGVRLDPVGGEGADVEPLPVARRDHQQEARAVHANVARQRLEQRGGELGLARRAPLRAAPGSRHVRVSRRARRPGQQRGSSGAAVARAVGGALQEPQEPRQARERRGDHREQRRAVGEPRLEEAAGARDRTIRAGRLVALVQHVGGAQLVPRHRYADQLERAVRAQRERALAERTARAVQAEVVVEVVRAEHEHDQVGREREATLAIPEQALVGAVPPHARR